MTFYEYLKAFTETYRAHIHDDVSLREAYCVAVQSRYEFLPLQAGEPLAGRKRVLPVGFLNEPLLGRSVCWFVDEGRAMLALENDGATEAEIEHAKAMLAFWRTQETRKNLRASYPADIAEALPEDIYWEHSEVAFPLYRVVGSYLDYDKLLRLGLDGMKAEIEAYQKAAAPGSTADGLYRGCRIALDALSDVARRYAENAAALGNARLSVALNKIAHEKPDTFLEAIQLAWLYSLISGVLNYGRMDDYLGDYLARDLDSGAITEIEALDILCCQWRLIDERKTVFHGRVIIGGRGRHNEANADRFAMLAMEASRIVAEAEPQLSLRFYEGQNPKLMEKALDVIGEGKVYPMLYNDDVNIPSVMRAFDLPESEAINYCFFGCGEYVINKRSTGSPNGIINLLKALEITLFNGHDVLDPKARGLALGAFESFASFEDFYAVYKEQLAFYIEKLARCEKMEYDYCAKVGSFLYISMLMDDCMARGKSLLAGGVRYEGGTLETYGNINTANSLYAIKTLVFEQKKIAPDMLLRALQSNFEGYEAERRMLLDAEKYGNDQDGADAMAVNLHEYVCRTVRDLAPQVGLHSYMVVIINNEANTVLGRFTAASADGRKAREPMANANNPAGGTDQNGVTAMLNSLVKLRTDIHAGAVQNMTFSSELFNDNRPVLRALLQTYFDNGGPQCMINVLHRGDLEDAMAHPERHQSLLVRVGGFSARFVTLSPDVQREIASRTLY
ncbi:MAG: pyruvate formate-lyase [Clostridia bacterium]|nr:pyruvate formate-lyase [Clostridia bacterium]